MSRVTSATESTGVCTARKTASSNMAASLGHGRRRVFGRENQVKVGSATDGRLKARRTRLVQPPLQRTSEHLLVVTIPVALESLGGIVATLGPELHDPVHPRGIELRVDVVDQDAGRRPFSSAEIGRASCR